MSLRKRATSGIVWTFAEQFGNQIVVFVVSTILARLLLPEQFGLIGMIAVFYAVGSALFNAGLTQSLVRSKKLDQVDYSTVFFYNLFSSIVIYFIMFFTAPLVAEFYGYPILIDIIRLYCLSFIIFAFSAVQQAKMTKEMNFKTQTIISLPSVILGGIVGIYLAYSGYGVWSIVWNQLITATFRSMQLWIYSKWTPSFVFSVPKFKEHFNFGYKITLSSILEKIFNNLYIIIIGKYFSATQVGFYTRADSMKNLPVSNITMALGRVTYPLFAEIQYDNIRLKRVYKQLMKMVVFVVAPLMIYLAVLAEPIFRFLFTEKWLPAVPYFQILCISGILYPIQAYNSNVLNVKGRSDIFLKLTVINKALLVLGVIIGMQFGIFGLLYAQVILSIISFFFYAHFTNKFIGYSAFQQAKDIIPILVLALLPGVAVYFLDIKLVQYHDFIRIICGLSLGGLLYLLLSYLLKLDSFFDLKNIIIKTKP